VNMYSLWVVGPFFEQLWGRRRFLALYLIAGLGGSCAIVINNPLVTGAGASGALWGILAAHAVWILANRRYLPGPMASQMLRQVVIVLVINIGITFGVPNISAAAHFGGGAIGAVTAVLLHYHRYGGFGQRLLAVLGLIAVPILSVAAVAEAERVDPRWQIVRAEHAAQQEIARANHALQILETEIRPVGKVYQEQYEALRKLDRDQLTPEIIEQAVSRCREARHEFESALETLRGVGPFQDRKLERQRLRRLESFEETLQGWQRTEQRMRKMARQA